MDKGNICSQILPIHRKAGSCVLPVKCLLQDRESVTPIDTNGIAWNVGGREKGEPHDVIPMHMGHEEVIDLRGAWAVLAHDLLPKAAQTRAHVADHVLCAANEFHTRRVATIAMPY